jgi:hypothetical protein
MPDEYRRREVIEMRRIAITACAAGALGLAIPGLAMARHHHHHHAGSVHHGRAHHARVEHITPMSGALAGRSSDGSTGDTGTTGPTTPPAETIGTIASFEHGTLKLSLNDGSTLSGAVIGDTEITCVPPEPTEAEGGGDDEEGPGHDGGDVVGSVSAPASGATSGEDEGGQDDDQNEDEGCGVAALVKGALVREVEIRMSPTGNTFEEITVIR